jgi:hypothetical protein
VTLTHFPAGVPRFPPHRGMPRFPPHPTVCFPPHPTIGGVESVLREGCPRTMTGVSQCWFSGHFRQVFSNTNALPRINIGADVWSESSIMTSVYQRWCSSTLHIGWRLCDRLCLVLVCGGRYGLGGVFLLFILESNLGGGGPVRGLRGGGRRGGGEEWDRSG